VPDSPDKISWCRAVLDTRDLTFLHSPYDKPIGALFNPEPKTVSISKWRCTPRTFPSKLLPREWSLMSITMMVLGATLIPGPITSFAKHQSSVRWRGLVRKFTVNFDNTKHTMVSHNLFNDFDLWDESTDRAVGALRAIFERDAVQFDVYIRDEDKNRLKIPPRTPSDFFFVRLRRVISFGTSTPSAYEKLTIPTTSIRALRSSQRPTVHRWPPILQLPAQQSLRRLPALALLWWKAWKTHRPRY